MGVIKKQSFFNSIIFYLGIAIGYVNVALLFPRFFTPEQFGLTRILITLSAILALIAQMALPTLTLKYFHFFRNDEKGHSGFLPLILAAGLGGFLVVLLGVFILKDWILAQYADTAELFVEYWWWVLPLTLFQVLFELLSFYTRSLFKSVPPTLLQEVVLRLMTFAIILLYYFDFLSFDQFILFFILSYGVNLLFLLLYLYRVGQLHLKPKFSLLKHPLIPEMLNFGFFTFLFQFSGRINQKLDLLMLGALLGLKEVAVYTIGVIVGELVTTPNKAIAQIASPALADAFKRGDMVTVGQIYKKTSINNLVLGSFLFLVIYVNIDNLLFIIDPDYIFARKVVFYIGLSQLVQVGAGVNGQIIINSSFYRMNLVFSFVLLAFTVTTNLIFIPLYGMTGAAMATALTLLLDNIIKSGFVWKKLDLMPYNLKTVMTVAVAAGVYLLGLFLPDVDILLLDILYKSTVIGLLFGGLAFFLHLSEDINETAVKVWRRYIGW